MATRLFNRFVAALETIPGHMIETDPVTNELRVLIDRWPAG
jgi:hypothetical protein